MSQVEPNTANLWISYSHTLQIVQSMDDLSTITITKLLMLDSKQVVQSPDLAYLKSFMDKIQKCLVRANNVYMASLRVSNQHIKFLGHNPYWQQICQDFRGSCHFTLKMVYFGLFSLCFWELQRGVIQIDVMCIMKTKH